MKKIKLLGFAAALFATALTTGCEKTIPGDVIQRNFVYVSEPSAVDGFAYEKVINHSASDVQFAFSVELIDYATEPVDVNINVDNATLVADYNEANELEYIAVPQGNLSFSGEGVATSGNTVTVTVPQGSNRASVVVAVTKDAMEIGKDYALSVKLSGAQGGATELAPEDFASLFFPVRLLGQFDDDVDLPGLPVPVSESPSFKFHRNDKNFALSTGLWNARFESDFTLETWVYISQGAFSSNGRNAQLFDNRKYNDASGNSPEGYGYGLDPNVDEFFVRWGNNVSEDKSDMEIKAFNGAGDNSDKDWRTGQWIHVAIVYKKRDNVLIVYRNGEQLQKVEGYPEPQGNPNDPASANYNADYPKDGKLRFKLLSMFGTHGGGVSAASTVAVRELRMWNTARRPAQIKNYMRLAVNTAEPRLVAYWPFGFTEGTPASFPNTAEWTATEDIPVAPPMTVFSDTYWGGWAESVDFANVEVTLKDGTTSTGSSTRAAVRAALRR